MEKFAYFVSGTFLPTLGNAKATKVMLSLQVVSERQMQRVKSIDLLCLSFIMISGEKKKKVCMVLCICVHISQSQTNAFDIFTMPSKEFVFLKPGSAAFIL